MAALPFTKMQAVGNDFVVFDGRNAPGIDWPALAARMCDRRFGVGADGLLIATPTREGDLGMHMLNPDGTADGCGNGMRCVARYAVERLGLGTPGAGGSVLLVLDTDAGDRHCAVHRDGRVTVDMAPPLTAPADLPMRLDADAAVDVPLVVGGEPLRLTVLNTGSTHAVVFVDELPDDRRFEEVSRALERHPAFPERTSIMWTRVDGPDALTLRIWERAVGETLGCGTGACAAAVAARMAGRVRPEVHVTSRGGVIDVRWEPGAGVVQTGPAEYVFEGVWPGPG